MAANRSFVKAMVPARRLWQFSFSKVSDLIDVKALLHFLWNREFFNHFHTRRSKFKTPLLKLRCSSFFVEFGPNSTKNEAIGKNAFKLRRRVS